MIPVIFWHESQAEKAPMGILPPRDKFVGILTIQHVMRAARYAIDEWIHPGKGLNVQLLSVPRGR